MFKTGVITDEISQDLKEACGLAMKYNLDAVEIRSVDEKGPFEFEKQDIVKMKSILADTNLKVCGISAPFFKCDLDNEAEIKANIESLKACIDTAHQLDTKFIRGFTFWAKGNFEDNFSKIVSKFEEPLKLIEREGITLVLEFDPSVYATNAQKLVKVIKEIDSPHIRGLWDPGNDIYDPDGEEPFPTGYEIIKPYMVHMHLKDAKKMPDGKVVATPVGEGQVDYVGHFKKLKEDNYDGYVVLETHYRPAHDLDDDILALPKGSTFSYLGYEASEDSLIKWKKLY